MQRENALNQLSCIYKINKSKNKLMRGKLSMKNSSNSWKQPSHRPSEEQTCPGKTQSHRECNNARVNFAPWSAAPFSGPALTLLHVPAFVTGPWLVLVIELQAEVLELQQLQPLLVSKELRGLLQKQSDYVFLLCMGLLCCFFCVPSSCLRVAQSFQQLGFGSIVF